MPRFMWCYIVPDSKVTVSGEGEDRNGNRKAGGGRVRAVRVNGIVEGYHKGAGGQRETGVESSGGRKYQATGRGCVGVRGLLQGQYGRGGDQTNRRR